MNRKGQVVFVGLMVAAVVFIMVVAMIEPLKDQAATARNASNLNCDNSTLSAGEAGTCIITDTYLFAWVGISLAVGLAGITARRLSLIGGGG